MAGGLWLGHKPTTAADGRPHHSRARFYGSRKVSKRVCLMRFGSTLQRLRNRLPLYSYTVLPLILPGGVAGKSCVAAAAAI